MSDLEKVAGLGSGLGLIFANPIVLVVLLVFFGVVFAVGYAILWLYGLVTAAILFLGGVVFLYLVGKVSPNSLKNPVLILIPVGLGAFGYVADHVPSFHLASLSGLQADNEILVVGGVSLGPTLLIAVVAVAILVVVVAAVATRKKKHGRKHR